MTDVRASQHSCYKITPTWHSWDVRRLRPHPNLSDQHDRWLLRDHLAWGWTDRPNK